MSDVNPPDPGTPVGQVRLTVGDSVFDATKQSYAYFTDAEVTQSLLNASGNVMRAAGFLINQLAVSLTASGQSVKASSFAINTLGRGGDLFSVAQSYFAQADAQDKQSGAEDPDGFAVVGPSLKVPRRLDGYYIH